MIPGLGKSPRYQGIATHFIILAWKIPWTEETGGLQSMESQRVGLNLSDCFFFFFLRLALPGVFNSPELSTLES